MVPIKSCELNNKQIMFINEYLIDRNAARAYIQAGYKVADESHVRFHASRLLAKPNIKAEVEMRMALISEKANVTTEWVLLKLKEVVERCMDEDNSKFDASGAIKALECIGKHLGMFKDKVDLKQKGIAPIIYVNHNIPRPKHE